MYFIAALALIFYVSKVPERYFPGERSSLFPSAAFISHFFTPSCRNAEARISFMSENYALLLLQVS